jgi:hypothetical protein
VYTQIEQVIRAAADYLRVHQQVDGHWEEYNLPVGHSDRWLTGCIALAFDRASKLHADGAALQWCRSRRQPDSSETAPIGQAKDTRRDWREQRRQGGCLRKLSATPADGVTGHYGTVCYGLRAGPRLALTRPWRRAAPRADTAFIGLGVAHRPEKRMTVYLKTPDLGSDARSMFNLGHVRGNCTSALPTVVSTAQ